MEHITNVLVYSNRCEIVDGHIFATGDKGLPHIRLKFMYMFGTESLQGKKLECKYLLPNGEYSAENISIKQKDETTFPIHYSCFTVNGWTTLRITLVNGTNRVTLDDITIKTKETKLGDSFQNVEVENAIANVIEVTTQSIQEEGIAIKREAKQEIDNYVYEKINTLKGEQGPVGPKGDRGPKGEKGDRGATGQTGPRGANGANGAKGEKGTSITGISLQNTNGLNKTYRISFSDNTYFDYAVKDGTNGAKGNDGHTPTISLNSNNKLIIDGVEQPYSLKGDKGDRGPTGPKGGDGKEIENISYENNILKLLFNDGSKKEVTIVSGSSNGNSSFKILFNGEFLISKKTEEKLLSLPENWSVLFLNCDAGSRGEFLRNIVFTVLKDKNNASQSLEFIIVNEILKAGTIKNNELYFKKFESYYFDSFQIKGVSVLCE